MFNTIIINPILNALVALYKLFLTLGVPGAFGFAIITLTILFRFALHPFFKQQLESQQKLNALKPKMSELQAKHKDDKTRLQQAQMDLYKEHGINPASGCLFAIVQIPIFIGLYQTLSSFVNAASSTAAIQAINKVLYTPIIAITKIDPNFFFFNLAISPEKYSIFSFSLKQGITLHPENFAYAYYLLVPLVTGFLQYLQAQKTLAIQPSPSKDIVETKDGKKKDPGFAGDFQSAMNTQMKYFFPVMIAIFSYQLPVGLSLYWNIFSIFSIIQSVRQAQSTKSLIPNTKT